MRAESPRAPTSKVRVEMHDTGATESFWLRVLGRLTDADDAYLGEVANELVLPGTPPLGALVEFKSKHVMNICDARDA